MMEALLWMTDSGLLQTLNWPSEADSYKMTLWWYDTELSY